MTYTTADDDDTFAVIGDYLERSGVTDLRHPHNSKAFNRSAIVRYLVAEKLQEALDHPPTPMGRRSRHGAGGKRSRINFSDNPTTKSRK